MPAWCQWISHVLLLISFQKARMLECVTKQKYRGVHRIHLVIIEHFIQCRALQDTELTFRAACYLTSAMCEIHLPFGALVLVIWEHVLRNWYPASAFQTRVNIFYWEEAPSEEQFPHFGCLDRDNHSKPSCWSIPSMCEFTSYKTAATTSSQESCSSWESCRQQLSPISPSD